MNVNCLEIEELLTVAAKMKVLCYDIGFYGGMDKIGQSCRREAFLLAQECDRILRKIAENRHQETR